MGEISAAMPSAAPVLSVMTVQPPAPAQAPAAPETPAAPGAAVGTERPVAGKVIINGREVTVVGGGGADVPTGTEFPFPRDIPPNVAEIAKDGIIGFTLMVIAFPVFGFAKALLNRRAAAPALPSRDTTDRLQRIEAAVESMAVEVERISEGQRFVTRVLAERSSSSQP